MKNAVNRLACSGHPLLSRSRVVVLLLATLA